jgi:EF hand
MIGAAALGGCGGDRHRDRGGERAPPPAPISPNGEPLVGGGPGASCDALLGQWFDAADLNHDGVLDSAEFMADAMRWFAVMDTNHDGSVTPDELTALRLKLSPPAAPSTRRRDDEEEETGGFLGIGGHRPRRPSERPDPVMSADVNLDNHVTPEEFQAQAGQVFAGLDRKHDGRLTKDEVMVGCQAQGR